MRHSKTRIRLGIAGCAVIVAGLAAGLWLTYTRERLLTRVARPILPISSTEEVYWLATDRLLNVTTKQDGIVAGLQWRGCVETYDITSRKRSRWPKLDLLLYKTEDGPWDAPIKFQPSPGGACLYWMNKVAGERLGRMVEIGHLPVKRPTQGDTEAQIEHIQWLPDGKHISFVYHGMLYVTDTSAQ